MYKVKNNQSTPFMQELFTHVEGYRTRNNDGNNFHRPNVNTVHRGKHSLQSFGPILWNTMLPKKLKDCESLEKFKDCIKTWTPDNCNCTLCKNYLEGVGYIDIFE